MKTTIRPGWFFARPWFEAEPVGYILIEKVD